MSQNTKQPPQYLEMVRILKNLSESVSTNLKLGTRKPVYNDNCGFYEYFLKEEITQVEKLPTEPREFLFKFLTEYNKKYYTFKPNNEVECDTHKARSFTEIFAVARTYFPDYQYFNFFQDFYHVCHRIIKLGIKIRVFYCCTISRPVIGVYTSYHVHPYQEYNKYFPFLLFGKNFSHHYDYSYVDKCPFLVLLHSEEVAFYLLGKEFA